MLAGWWSYVLRRGGRMAAAARRRNMRVPGVHASLLEVCRIACRVSLRLPARLFGARARLETSPYASWGIFRPSGTLRDDSISALPRGGAVFCRLHASQAALAVKLWSP